MTIKAQSQSIFVILIGFLLSNTCEGYPQGSIRCYHTLARPDRQVICPESRNGYCMKETTNLPQSLCGKTQYFGDRFVNGVCQYKKCLDTCVESEYQFEYKDQIYNRKRYCCKNNLCNDAFSLRGKLSWSVVALMCISIIFLF